jgi:hypothetical protein
MKRNEYYGTDVQPIDFIDENKCLFNEGNVLKYLYRAGIKDKDTFLEDIEKACWYLERDFEHRKIIRYTTHSLNARVYMKELCASYLKEAKKNNVPYYEAIHGIIYATFICNVDLSVTLGLLRFLILEARNANTR